jgi:hypothetical protein
MASCIIVGDNTLKIIRQKKKTLKIKIFPEPKAHA